MEEAYTIELARLADQMQLENLTPSVPLEGRTIDNFEINRLALQLAGYMEFFKEDRVQIVGKVEYSYLLSMEPEKRHQILDTIFSSAIPCLILCRGMKAEEDPEILRIAERHRMPVLCTPEVTSLFTTRLVQYLAEELAPRITMHGVMLDVFGEGVLIIGESGFGKSETALELVQRGHRLVADDVVEIRKVSDTELLATGVDIIRNLLELRGIGVINVKELYGVQAVRLSKTIDMVVRLEQWQLGKQYDRIGTQTETLNILDSPVSCYTVPLMVGRNVSMIIEAAALNHRQKKMGYNAADELRERVSESLATRKKSQENRNE